MSGSEKEDESFAALFESSSGAHAHRKSFRVGERIDVRVVAIGRDAVFADLGGKEEGCFDKASLVDAQGKLSVEVGSSIAAVVTALDDVSGQVQLSPVFVRRAESEGSAIELDEEDEKVVIPRAKSGPLLIEGAHVVGKVTGVERYGVFVQIGGTQGRGGRGLVPTPETATPRGSDLKKHFTVGQDIEAKILHIAEDGRIRLSISALAADAEQGELVAFVEREKQGAAEAGKGDPRNFGTLGQLFAKKDKKKKR